MYQTISSNHYSHEQQVTDALEFLARELPERHAEMLTQFPELADDEFDWTDHDPELSSWVADAIESDTPIQWRDGEPWVVCAHLNGGSNYSTGDPEFFASVTDAVWVWFDRRNSNGIRRCADGTLYPCWGDGLDADDYVITGHYTGITYCQALWIYERCDNDDEIPEGWLS